jgi:hypothetical protein
MELVFGKNSLDPEESTAAYYAGVVERGSMTSKCIKPIFSWIGDLASDVRLAEERAEKKEIPAG